MRKLGLLFIFIIGTLAGVNSQVIDTFNIIFKQDFEDNTLGEYGYDEWAEDWNYPTWANRQVLPTIEQNTDLENGSKVMRWHYPEGSLGPDEGGGQWFGKLDNPCDEIYFSFDMKLKPGFVWVLGGKIHGLIAEPFKGFDPPEYDEGGMILLMWNDDHKIMFYYYHQDQTHYYGDIKEWNYTFETGKWYNITIRFVLNTITDSIGNNDAIMEGFVDGKLVCQAGNLRFRNLESIKTDILEITSFFGGGDDNWRAQRDEWMDVDNFIAFNYTDAVDVPRGNTLSPSYRELILPGSNVSKTPAPIPTPGDTVPTIKVKAYGSEVNGENAHIKVLVNNVYIGENYVTTEMQTYSFLLDSALNDNDTVSIIFDNDLYISEAEDRNLFIHSITANNKVYDPNNKNVVFSYDSNNGVEVQYGSNYLSWDGQLTFFLGEVEVLLDDIYLLFNPEEPETNDPPVVENQNYLITDNLQKGSIIGTIEATDPNKDQLLSYSIIEGNINTTFIIDSSDGELSVNDTTSLTSVDSFYLHIEVKDDGLGNLSDTGLVTINIKHVDTTLANNPPIISNQKFNINENDNLSSLAMQIVAYDPDLGQNLTYSILSGNDKGAFNLSPSSGQLTVVDTSKLDFQDETEINLNVQVQDDGEGFLIDSAFVKINLIPEMTTFYIDPQNTNDLLEDGSIEHPYDTWKNISWEDGKSYFQKKGTTANEGKINVYASNVIIGAYGQGDMPVIISSATDFAIRVFEKTNISIQNLKIVADEAISCIYFLGESCDSNIVENCYLECTNNCVRIIDGKTVTLKYNTFSNSSDAIYSFAETTKIYYNIFNGNGTGININSYLSSTEIYNNVFYDNSKGVATSYSSLTIYNNIFYMTDQGDQAINHKLDNLVSDNNIFYPEQDGFLDIADKKYSSLYDYQQTTGLDLNSFTSDPLFKDIYNNNFSVETGSPAIDAGKNVGILMDFYGYSVPFGGAPDIGLIELMNTQGVASSIFDYNTEEDCPLIFPNPSDGNFKISFKDVDFQISEMNIKDMAGNLIYKDYLECDGDDIIAEVDISHVPRGVYLVFLAIDDKIYTQRIIIN